VAAPGPPDHHPGRFAGHAQLDRAAAAIRHDRGPSASPFFVGEAAGFASPGGRVVLLVPLLQPGEIVTGRPSRTTPSLTSVPGRSPEIIRTSASPSAIASPKRAVITSQRPQAAFAADSFSTTITRGPRAPLAGRSCARIGVELR